MSHTPDERTARVRLLRRSVGVEPCRYAVPMITDLEHCNGCGRRIHFVPAAMKRNTIQEAYYRHVRAPRLVEKRAAAHGAAALGGGNPQDVAPKLSLPEVALTIGEGSSGAPERGNGLDRNPRRPKGSPQSPRGVWTESDYRRFRDKLAVDANGCWIWHGSKSGFDYGQFWLDGRRMGAHVAAWMLFWGDVPDGYDVMHECDVSLCVNPEHLKPGTRAQNQKHASEAGRLRSCVLDEETILAVRRDYAAGGVTYAALGRRYDMSGTNAWLIVNRRIWAHVA